jgi:hypothetical protein
MYEYSWLFCGKMLTFFWLFSFTGSAGAQLDAFYAATTTYSNPWTARYVQGVYGYGKLAVNETGLHFTFVRHGDEDDDLLAGQVMDSLWIPRRV